MKDEELRASFDSIGARFEQMEARFEQMDARFEKMDARFEQMDARFEKMDARFEQVDRRFEQVLRAIIDVDAETRRVLTHALLDTREQLSARIDDAVENRLDSFRDETHANFDHVFGRFDRLETEYYAISAGLTRVEKRFSEDA